jgi:type IV pilus assembly protein PilE
MHDQQAFSFIELLISLIIITILASIAYPSYVKQIQKSKRLEAKVALYSIAQQQEDYFLQHMSYAANLSILHNTTTTTTTSSNNKLSYQIAISDRTPNNCTSDKVTACTAYTVTATAIAAQNHDSQCKKMHLNNLGQETAENTTQTDTSTLCW